MVEVIGQFVEGWQILTADQQDSVTDRVDLLAGRGRHRMTGTGIPTGRF